MNNDSSTLTGVPDAASAVLMGTVGALALVSVMIAVCLTGIYVAQCRRPSWERTPQGTTVLWCCMMPIMFVPVWCFVALKAGLSPIPDWVGPLLVVLAQIALAAIAVAGLIYLIRTAVRSRSRLRMRATRARETYAQAMALFLDIETVQAYDRPELVSSTNPAVKRYLAKMRSAQAANTALMGSRIATNAGIERAQTTASDFLSALEYVVSAHRRSTATIAASAMPPRSFSSHVLSGIKRMMGA